MNPRWPCLLFACVLLSGCAAGAGSRAHTSAAPASSGSFQTSAYSTPRNSVRIAHQPQAPQTGVTYFKHAEYLSPRLQGFYRVNPTRVSFDASASVANIRKPGSPGEAGDDKTIVRQPLGSGTFGPMSNQVAAASLFPVVEPHYAALISIMIVFAALVYSALYKFAGFVGQAAGTIPQEGGSDSSVESQPPSRDSGAGPKAEDVKASSEVRMGQEEAEMQSNIKRTFKQN